MFVNKYFVMVYTLEGKLVHEFGGEGSHPGRFKGPAGICVDDNGVVYVVDWKQSCASFLTVYINVFVNK